MLAKDCYFYSAQLWDWIFLCAEQDLGIHWCAHLKMYIWMFENSFNQNLRTLIQIRLLFKNIPAIDGKGLPQEEATMSSGMAQGLQKVSKVPRSWKKPDPPPRNLQNTKDWFKGTPIAQLVDCASLSPPLCICCISSLLCQCSFPHPHTMCITLKDTPTQDQMVQF